MGGSSDPILGKCPEKLTNSRRKGFLKKDFLNNKIAIAEPNYKFLFVKVPCCSIGRDLNTDIAAYRQTEKVILKIIKYKLIF